MIGNEWEKSIQRPPFPWPIFRDFLTFQTSEISFLGSSISLTGIKD